MKPACILLISSLFTTQGLAMSKSPEPYAAPQWHETANAVDDAAYALKHDDTRLLAYYGRGVVLPGIQPDEKEILSETCGLRMMDGFGDVVRSDAHLEKMKIMRAYAEKYNQLVAPHCRKHKE